MADEEQGEGRIRHVGENVQLNGRTLRRGDPLAAGTLVVTHVYRRPDGSEIAAPMQFTLDLDLFREELEIRFKRPVPPLEAGASASVEFEIVGGAPEVLLVYFSSAGNNPANFQAVPDPSSPGRPLVVSASRGIFTFTVPDVESPDCYIALEARGRANTYLGNAISNQFAVTVPAAPEGDIVVTMPPEVEQKQPLMVQFTFDTGKLFDGFSVLLTHAGKTITRYVLTNLPPERRQFLFVVPDDVEGDDWRLTVSAKRGGVVFKLGMSNPFTITKKGGRKPGPPGPRPPGPGPTPPVDVPVIEGLLRRGLTLPKRPLFANRNKKTLNIAQFASEVVFSDKSVLRDEIKEKIPVVIGRLEDLKNELDASGYQSQNPRNYDQFMKIFLDIEAKKKHFLRLNDPKEFADLQGTCAYGFERVKEKPEFAEIFDKNFATPLDKHEWPMLYRDPEKLAFLFRQRDTIGVTAIQHLYRSFDVLYEYLFQLDASFRQMKKVLSQVRKDLGI